MFQQRIANDFKVKMVRNSGVQNIMKKDLAWAKAREKTIRDEYAREDIALQRIIG